MQAKEELDALKELNKARRNLAFGSAQADIDEKFREMSSELKASREQMEVRYLLSCVDCYVMTRQQREPLQT